MIVGSAVHRGQEGSGQTRERGVLLCIEPRERRVPECQQPALRDIEVPEPRLRVEGCHDLR